MFFIGVASKGLRVPVSGLESTHAGVSISVDSKGVAGGAFVSPDEAAGADSLKRRE